MEDAVVESFRQKLSKFDYIRFCACNFHGMSKGKVVPARNAANFIKRGAQAWNGEQKNVCLSLRLDLVQHALLTCQIGRSLSAAAHGFDLLWQAGCSMWGATL